MKLDAKLFSNVLNEKDLEFIAIAVIEEAKDGNMQAVLFLKNIFDEEEKENDKNKVLEFFRELENIEDITIAVDFDDEEETVTMSA